MSYREQVIKAAYGTTLMSLTSAERIADAILALPDPVHEAAREVVGLRYTVSDVAVMDEALTALDATLSAECVPQTYAGMPVVADERVPPGRVAPITDEMVERAFIAYRKDWEERSHHDLRRWSRRHMRAALDAALNGGER